MNPPYIPATALGGDLVRDWTGPAEQRNEMDDDERTEFWSEIVLMPRIQRSRPSVVADGLRYATNGWGGDIAPDFVRLDPRREEVATRIATVLRARGHEVGHLLPVALGGRQGDAIAVCDWCGGCREVPPSSPVSDGQTYETCSGCDRDGRVVIRAADVSAVLLAASVAGVEAERGVVRGVLFQGDYNIWRDDDGTVEFPPGEQPTALAAGYAYLSPAAPFGVVVPFLRDGREMGP